MSMPARPTLLTGATGFVGSAVARVLLARGHTLRVLARPGGERRNIAGLPVEIVEGDLTDAASLRRALANCRFLFHVAADYRLWVPDPAAMMRANVEGTQTILREAMAAGVERIVYCSSVAALGLTADGSPADETTPMREGVIVGPYKRSKYAAEQAVLALAREGMPVVIVNPSTPVGPRDIKPTPTGKLILDAAAGRMPAYLDTGLNIVHVDDVAEGHVRALEAGLPGERYILGGENMKLRQLLDLVDVVCGHRRRRLALHEAALWPVALACEGLAHAAGIAPLVTRDHLRMARKQMMFSSAKAMAELGYAPRPAHEAVAEAVAWFRAAGQLGRAKAA